MAWNDGIEGPHREIPGNPARILHVLAGPGTGKTFAMIRRIARLLEDDIAASRILAVTFTRTAARDLREQLSQLDISEANDVRATTLHSLCFGLLSSQEAFAFNTRTPRPLMAFELHCLEDDLAHFFGGKKDTRRLLEAYEAGWARLQRDGALDWGRVLYSYIWMLAAELFPPCQIVIGLAAFARLSSQGVTRGRAEIHSCCSVKGSHLVM